MPGRLREASHLQDQTDLSAQRRDRFADAFRRWLDVREGQPKITRDAVANRKREIPECPLAASSVMTIDLDGTDRVVTRKVPYRLASGHPREVAVGVQARCLSNLHVQRELLKGGAA